MQKLINNEWIDCTEADLVDNDFYRIPVGNGGFEGKRFMSLSSTYTETRWRDSELQRTDDMLQPDRTNPSYQQILDYRQELKDYPQQSDFPNGTRPTL